ncbi:MAG: response regulator transcription factor [Prevotella sp.]|jgi:DNA-binding CsgD family transcriptional regulator|nr:MULTISPECIES: response regulator transcription factor [unclassified Prevotella]MCH3970444.1 response regulator transcription factor [Prevotella sp.]MCH3991043.1 response regulator transcription factor [Prevotella sp.]MCH4018182.1 response regulator transcription factor [Prevotella sp.]MCH4100499.1 response regulator transcription factor [Prevotella sp.]MCH4216055.1 response regulator transcription factor [Prevotella sp.]
MEDKKNPNPVSMMRGRPKLAIIDSNTLAEIGLKQMLHDVIPFMDIETFYSFDDLKGHHPDTFFHYFVTNDIVLTHRLFFLKRQHKTIVLTNSADPNTWMKDFHYICVNVPEKQLVKSLLRLEQFGHPHGKNLPPMPKAVESKVLTDREVEVLSLIAQGYLNKEIADKLNICLTTVITHRKNIQEKLGKKSVAALTIYAVMHGYVDINKI